MAAVFGDGRVVVSDRLTRGDGCCVEAADAVSGVDKVLVAAQRRGPGQLLWRRERRVRRRRVWRRRQPGIDEVVDGIVPVEVEGVREDGTWEVVVDAQAELAKERTVAHNRRLGFFLFPILR